LLSAWRQLHADLNSFLKTWGDEADYLGWSDRELYGMAMAASRVRFGEMGLVPILAGRRVVAMDETHAVIECQATRGYTPARQTFVRHSAGPAIEAELAARATTLRHAMADPARSDDLPLSAEGVVSNSRADAMAATRRHAIGSSVDASKYFTIEAGKLGRSRTSAPDNKPFVSPRLRTAQCCPAIHIC
jgi:hypothetical protein